MDLKPTNTNDVYCSSLITDLKLTNTKDVSSCISATFLLSPEVPGYCFPNVWTMPMPLHGRTQVVRR
jgi:hypothetical protein